MRPTNEPNGNSQPFREPQAMILITLVLAPKLAEFGNPVLALSAMIGPRSP